MNTTKPAGIDVSLFSTVPTIVFINKAHLNPTPSVWVCRSRDSFDMALKELRAMKHIEIVEFGDSHVQ